VYRDWPNRAQLARDAPTPRYRDLTYKSSPITSDVPACPRHRADYDGRLSRLSPYIRAPLAAISPRYVSRTIDSIEGAQMPLINMPREREQPSCAARAWR